MKDAFHKLYNDLKKARVKCPWAKDQSITDHIKELKSELEEVREAIENNDLDNLKEELGDVFMDALFLMVIAEDIYGHNIDEIITDVNNKIVRRKPWVFGDMKITTKDEAIKMWNEIKQKEKSGEL